ncbi:MAG: GNAT family N-acetyltransferase [Rickettsiales bacterium]|jgi:putative hemolysin|nr:GNAT family N-acetyltransferase [Rickettsiales bacterium]
MTPITIGNLTVRLAASEKERMEAYELMKDVFIEDNKTPADSDQLKTDISSYKKSDILITVDNITNKIVATYRLITRETAQLLGGFYTESEFDIAKIKEYDGNSLEFSRACTHKDYRDNATMMATWKGLAAYILDNDIKVMFGVPSFHGTDVGEYKNILNFLMTKHVAPDYLTGQSLQDNRLEDTQEIDVKEAYDIMPPLLKSYIRMGATIGNGFFIDYDFNTIDVLLIVELSNLDKTYLGFFSRGL